MPRKSAQAGGVSGSAGRKKRQPSALRPPWPGDLWSAEDDPKHQAQQLAFDAMGEQTPKAILKKLKAALELDPECVDALTMLADIVAESAPQHIDLLREAVAVGERQLGGPAFFRQHRGNFWSLLETRPYMRARAELAAALHRAGTLAESLAELLEMLRLNPGDNQGMRYVAVGLALELRDADALERLLSEYDENSAVWLWAGVARQFLKGDERAAKRALKAAMKCNSFVLSYLSGDKPHPKGQVPFYSPGDESEAIMCLDCIGAGWNKHPELVVWLRQQATKK